MDFSAGVQMGLVAILKRMGIDGEAVLSQVTGIQNTIGQIFQSFALVLSLQYMTNRRLARIEAALGLNDIEPVPEEPKGLRHEDAHRDDVAFIALPGTGQ